MINLARAQALLTALNSYFATTILRRLFCDNDDDLMPFTKPNCCTTCGTLSTIPPRRTTAGKYYYSDTCERYDERAQIPLADRKEDLCLSCKRIRLIDQFWTDYTGKRHATCTPCAFRRRDYYLESKNEQVSKEGQKRRFLRAQKVRTYSLARIVTNLNY